VTFAVLAAGVVAYSLLQSDVLPALFTMQSELHTSQSAVTWVLTAYLLSASVCTPVMGRIGDAIGKQRVFVATLSALAAGSLLAALAPTIQVMIVARVVQGVGGGVLPLAFGIVRDEFPPEKVTGAVGSIATLTAVGAGLGTVLAGPVVGSLGFRWLFWLPMILTLAAAAAAAWFIPESPVDATGRVSIPSAALFAGWLVALLVALSEGALWGWSSGRVLGLLAMAVLLAGAWIVCESRSRVPLIDLRLLLRTAVWTTNLVGLLVGIGMYALFAFVPAFVQTPSAAGYGFDASVTESGLILLPASVLTFVVGQCSGRLSAFVGGRALVIAGGSVGAAGVALLAFLHDDVWQIYFATGVFGIGIGLSFSAMSALVVDAVPVHQTGVASGLNANIRTIGGSIGSALMASAVVGGSGTDYTSTIGLPAESGYTTGFAMLAVAFLLSALAALLIPGDRHVNRSGTPALTIAPAGSVVG